MELFLYSSSSRPGNICAIKELSREGPSADERRGPVGARDIEDIPFTPEYLQVTQEFWCRTENRGVDKKIDEPKNDSRAERTVFGRRGL